MKTNKIRIDLDRNLCETCKHQSDCSFDNQEYGENGNVIRCKKFLKPKNIISKVNNGQVYFYISNLGDNLSTTDFEVKSRVESDSRIDNLLREVKNYFHTAEECKERIEKIKNKLAS